MKRRRPALPKPTKNRGFCDFSFSPFPETTDGAVSTKQSLLWLCRVVTEVDRRSKGETEEEVNPLQG